MNDSKQIIERALKMSALRTPPPNVEPEMSMPQPIPELPSRHSAYSDLMRKHDALKQRHHIQRGTNAL